MIAPEVPSFRPRFKARVLDPVLDRGGIIPGDDANIVNQASPLARQIKDQSVSRKDPASLDLNPLLPHGSRTPMPRGLVVGMNPLKRCAPARRLERKGRLVVVGDFLDQVALRVEKVEVAALSRKLSLEGPQDSLEVVHGSHDLG